MTSTENAVGMEGEARNAPENSLRIEARERLEALSRDYRESAAKTRRNLGDSAVVVVTTMEANADAIDTILSALSEAEGELDRMREALRPFAWIMTALPDTTDDGESQIVATRHLRKAQAALSPTRRTGDA